ncbi:MAG: rhombosortase [Gammaproteobacteria bacterium]|nr:rhombosortase [Gammaproteobacteria bacterium]
MISFNSKTYPGWIFVVCMLVVMVMLQLFGQELFRYQYDWLESAEYWRLITTHWAHTNWMHLLLNAAGLVLCLTVASPEWSIKRWLIYQFVFALGISLLFNLFNPELTWYLGYSGILYGIFLLAALDLYPRDKLIALLLGSAIVIKITLEQTSEINFNSSDIIGSPVIIDAHLYGVILAITIALVNHVTTILSSR